VGGTFHKTYIRRGGLKRGNNRDTTNGGRVAHHPTWVVPKIMGVTITTSGRRSGHLRGMLSTREGITVDGVRRTKHE